MLNFSWLLLLCLHGVLPQTTDKYSDEDRPYKFGFNIQGYQHRQEEKDEKGLIKGEYGFITADGYYRVTVYATDENGDFKILSMKNYYVGFPPEDPTTTPGPPTDRARQPQPPPAFGSARGPTGRALGGDDNSARTPKSFTRPQGIAACSDCSIPTTTPKTSQPSLVGNFRTGRTRTGNDQPNFGQGQPQLGQGQPQFGLGQPQLGQGQPQLVQGQPQFGQSPARVGAQAPGGGLSQFPQRAQSPAGGPTPQIPQGTPGINTQFSGRPGSSAPPQSGGSFEGNQSPRGFGGGGAFGSPEGPQKGRTDLTNNQIDGTPKGRPRIGEVRDGLPPGVTVNDIKDLLYTFNYTVGFHGHHEDGYRNGDKQGDYFFDGRDGVERKVEYLANEFGYQPNITLIDLPENDIRRPNEQTEKEYGLKGYEFKWFYRK